MPVWGYDRAAEERSLGREVGAAVLWALPWVLLAVAVFLLRKKAPPPSSIPEKKKVLSAGVEEEGEPPQIAAASPTQRSPGQVLRKRVGGGTTVPSEAVPPSSGSIARATVVQESSRDDRAAALRAELSSLRFSKLVKRARAAGASEEELEAAEEADDDKAATVELVLKKELLMTGAGESSVDVLRAELSQMKMSKLIKRAAAVGVGADALEAAEDEEDDRSAVIQLILQTELNASGEFASDATRGDSLQSELVRLRLKELRTRAKSEGVDADLLEDAMDQDDPKAAVIQLLLDSRAATEGTRHELASMRLTELRARAKEAGHSAEDLEEAIDSDEPKAAVIELLLSPPPVRLAKPQRAPAPQPEPEPDPESEPVAQVRSLSSVPAGDHPLLRALEAHQLEAHFEKLLELGVKRVEDLEHMNESDVKQLGMLKFDRAKFVSAFITETPHHGATVSSDSRSSTAAVAATGCFRFEGDAHAMFSYQWDDQEHVVRVREHFESLGCPTWMVRPQHGSLLNYHVSRNII